MEERYYHYWLSQVKFEAGVRRALKGNAEQIRREFERDPKGLCEKDMERKLDFLGKQQIQILLPGDLLFEEVFGDMAGKGIMVPYILYASGDMELLRKNGIAFVGSRSASGYGLRVTRELVASLEGQDVSIISGGARGVDRIAHETALEAGLPTICVLGCGIGYNYPPEHRVLFERIRRHGLLLSEYEPFQIPVRYFFPERNRIIAQLSEVVIVTCAAQKSGALITAEHAMDCNHKVYTVPHNIFDKQGEGCNFLLETGAGIITKSEYLREIIS